MATTAPATTTEVLRYAAFTDTPEGGNPAGVVLDACGLDTAAMLRIAAEVGYSETAFVTAQPTGDALHVRYFSPAAEVPFCGHATIATGIAWADHHGPQTLRLQTRAGMVTLEVSGDPAVATLTSVAPHSSPVDPADLARTLEALGWREDELDRSIPPRVAYAGAHHLVLATETPERLDDLEYDFFALRELMLERSWTTLQLVHRLGPDRFRARNPFPVGNVVEDSATGAAAAAFGGLLRELGLVSPPATLQIEQGAQIGRPSLLHVEIPAGADTGIRVSGTAVPIPAG